jgi:hypothetical protein
LLAGKRSRAGFVARPVKEDEASDPDLVEETGSKA